MLAPEDAWARLEPHLTPLETVEMPLASALGRRLVRDQSACADVPFADVSAMDGYAYAGDRGAGARLPVAGRIAAGDPPGRPLPEGGALRIMTGAPVPAGADRVIPVEQTDGGRDLVTLQASVAAGANIRRRAEVHRRGDTLVPASTELRAETLGLLASHGHLSVPVHRPPRVSIVVTGDEVVPPDEEPAPGRLRDAHGAFLAAAATALGAETTWLGIAPDRRDALEAFVRRGLAHDVLLLTGGVSMGELDFVEDVLTAQGCDLLFDAVAVQPGKPLVAAVHERGLVFGLPGNPASVVVTFRLFVQPALRRLQGHDDRFWHGALRARLAGPLPGARGRDRFLPARLAIVDRALEATPLPGRGSHDLAGHALGAALVRVRAGAGPREAGEACEVLPATGFC